MRPRGDVVYGAGRGDVSDALERDESRAVLRGLFGVGLFQNTVGPGDRTEGAVDQLERFFGVELARDDEHGVVGLIVFLVEAFQAFDGHAFDVRPVADRGLAVVVPEVRSREHSLGQDAHGIVLAHLELVTDDGHLAGEVVRADATVDHTVRLHAQREAEVLLARRQRLEVVCTVHPGGCVE